MYSIALVFGHKSKNDNKPTYISTFQTTTNTTIPYTQTHLFNIEMNEGIVKIYICICVETTTILKHYLKTTLTHTKWKEEKTLLEIWFCISNYFPSYNYYSSFLFAFATQLQFTINTNTQTQTQITTHPHNRMKMFSLRQKC